MFNANLLREFLIYPILLMLNDISRREYLNLDTLDLRRLRFE
jgi:hypothetical protein